MQQAALAQKVKHHQPDIYLRTEIHDVRMLDFSRIEQVFAQAGPAVDSLKRQLEALRTELR
jgi:hypothetical protein